jgi:deazaflavin-dependent oxidoreductase (nitroreductase family)
MGFDTPAGTRGARQPRAGLMLRWVNKMAARRIRRTGKMMGLGFNALILTTVGAKSGAQRTNPVGWFPGNDGSWLIVASAAGAARNPAWYHNIAAHPGQVKIERIAASALTSPQKVADTVAGFTEAGCDELILYPCNPDTAQVSFMAEAAGLR